ncbi:MAG: DUF371 domain-containing protein [Candidatus Korarchaeota archaeon]|nr:DUF371 domain-containing protein [Candidatus Korarchaeota archaeon]
MALEYVEAWGHVNVRATHRSTLEVTRETRLSPRGDCIVGVSASKAPSGFSEDFRRLASRRGSIIVAVLCGPGGCDAVVGRVDPRITLSDDTRMVLRRSSHVGGETVMVGADKGAAHLDRKLVESLRDPGARLQVVLVALDPSCVSTE